MNQQKVSIPLIGSLNVILFLAFFFAKIFDKIDWSWWWIFCPLWIPSALGLVVFLIILILYLLFK